MPRLETESPLDACHRPSFRGLRPLLITMLAAGAVACESDGAVEHDGWTRQLGPADTDAAAPANSCAEAEGMTPAAGFFMAQGDLAEFTSELDAVSCLPWGSPGADMIMPIVVPPGATLLFGGEVSPWDAQVYLLSTCDSTPTCVAGFDDAYPNQGELGQYTHDGPDDAVLYVVLDIQDPMPTPGTFLMRAMVMTGDGPGPP